MKLFFIPMLVLLASCASNKSYDVTAFHDNPQFSGKTFSIVSNKAQLDSLEYVQYANLISDELEAKGMEFITSNARAEYLVSFDYGIDGTETRINTRHSPSVYGGVGGGYRGGGFGGFSVPIGGGYDSYSATDYNKKLTLDIKSKSGKKVYEASVIGQDGQPSFYPSSDCMVRALFQNFPQQSGKVNRVTIPSESCKFGK